MDQSTLQLLQEITAPFAHSGAYVQGPGGNTSVKKGDELTIKASGFTFRDVEDGQGMVTLSTSAIECNLQNKLSLADSRFENEPPAILSSQPPGLRPSMEFEFHAILDRFVIHTHSVVANVLLCAKEGVSVLSQLFAPDEFTLVPYQTPGFPIAAYLLNTVGKENIAPVIFLKNHGLIVHGEEAAETIARYRAIESKIKNYLALPAFSCPPTTLTGADQEVIDQNELTGLATDLSQTVKVLTEEILIPDQSIFFRNRVGYAASPAPFIHVDEPADQVILNGQAKFRAAALEMFGAVYYLRDQISRLGWTADYIPAEKIAVMHNLSTEKYRVNLLKNQ